jgi:hypothetical protein
MGQERGKCLFDGAQQNAHSLEHNTTRALQVACTRCAYRRANSEPSPSPPHHRQLSVPLPPLVGLAYPHATHVCARLGSVGQQAPFNRGWTPPACLYSELKRPSLWALTNDRRCRDGAIPRDPVDIAPSTRAVDSGCSGHAGVARPGRASVLFIGDAAGSQRSTLLSPFLAW